jgi:hypothetical protein
METILKGENKNFTNIENWANENDFNLTELGKGIIGETFIVCKHEYKDITVSFILDSHNSSFGNQYTCVYSDLN